MRVPLKTLSPATTTNSNNPYHVYLRWFNYVWECVCVYVYEVLRRVPRGFSHGEIAKQQSYVLGIYLTVFKSIITSESINSEIHRSESCSSRTLHFVPYIIERHTACLCNEGRRVTANQPLLPPRPSHGRVCILNSWHYIGHK